MMWALAIISLLGNLLNSLRIRACFLIWIACNIGWMMYDLRSGTYSRALLDFVQIGFSVFGFYKWGKRGQATRQICQRTEQASCGL